MVQFSDSRKHLNTFSASTNHSFLSTCKELNKNTAYFKAVLYKDNVSDFSNRKKTHIVDPIL